MDVDLTEFTAPLARTPFVLRAIIEGRPDAWLDARHSPDVLSPREAVAHLVQCEYESWVTRVKRIMHPDQSFPIPPHAEMDEVELLAIRSVDELLDEFDSIRTQRINELIALNLSSSDMQKKGAHPKFGDYTVGNLIATWVAHDLYHLGQIFKSYSAPYVDQIGPWQYYLNLPQFN